jgi:alkanesulfonate monooxygenase SsuD/methylene tetrahydromethanopterin reductase-like flavin-dependent oxidoreductase (luciferase family)
VNAPKGLSEREVGDDNQQMKLGLQISRFRWPGGPPQIASTLASIARAADDAGFTSIWLMDHFFQIGSVGKPEDEMLEAYTTLGFLAAHTTRARLGTLVSGAHHRHPGVLIKQVTTLDLLSAGRACLGIGAGWYERESKGLGIPFPRLNDRFGRLEETLKVAHQMWPDDAHRPPILIGGGGERRTLRLVARYADACNLFARLPVYDLARKLEKLRDYCDEAGRPWDAIEKTALANWNLARQPQQKILDRLRELRELEFDTVIASLNGVETLKPIEILARDILPVAEGL